jgi:hypothetical protein
MPAQNEIDSDDWTIRRGAFARLLGMDPLVYSTGGVNNIGDVVRVSLAIQALDDQRHIALLNLLMTENRVVVEGDTEVRSTLASLRSNRLSEEYVNYYGDVVIAVATARDARALPALLGAIRTGTAAMDAVASYGAPAIGPLLELMDSPDNADRYSSALALWRILVTSQSSASDPSARARIKTALIEASRDPYSPVRQAAVVGLVALGDPESLGVVSNLAVRDPYRAEYQTGRPYVVREAAARALLALQ